MRPTRLWVLLLLVIVAAGAGYALAVSFYVNFDSPSALASLWPLLLALAEGYAALMTRARLAGRQGTRPINPLVVARLAALAKATSPVGALLLGGYTGFLLHVARTPGPKAHDDTRTAILSMATSLLLVVAALLLERVCRVRRPPDQEPPLAG
jgi:hypothetical protein